MDKRKVTQIDYTNWRGERRLREILPTGHLEFSNTEYHPEPQWLLGAVDIEDGKVKLFALKDIHGFGLTEPASPWLDIESAPKDGTKFLAWFTWPGRHSVEMARWQSNQFAKQPKPYWTCDNERLHGIIATRAAQPTHWMPLPEPPR